MKIGIVTFYQVPNYGAMLQAYALKAHLSSCGHDVVFVNFPYGETDRIKLWRCLVSRNKSDLVRKLEKYFSFEIVRFSSTYPATQYFATADMLLKDPPRCDVFITGSDQVWNSDYCSRRWIDVVFLAFPLKQARKIAYAASFGKSSWGDKSSAYKVGELLKRFEKISVREESAKKLVRELSGRSAEVMIDPTLLFDRDFYLGIVQGDCKKPIADKYIFSYLLNRDSLDAEMSALEVCKKFLGVDKVVTDKKALNGSLRFLSVLLGVKKKITVQEWLQTIYNSMFVFTNSYHGVIFSIVFQKPFVAILSRGVAGAQNERMLSLLNMLNLKERMLYASECENATTIIKKEIDWMAVESRLEKERAKARNFLEF